MSQIVIRLANLEDAEELYNIYEPYIMNSVITFEYDKVPVYDFRMRIQEVMKKFPWLVCCIDGKIAGYAYCSPHLVRAAFAWDCECTVYLGEEYQKKGIGSALYQALFELVKEQGYYNIYSLICVPNVSSVALHKKFGFADVGTYYNTAYKFGEWRHLLVMEKNLRPYQNDPILPISFHQLAPVLVEDVLDRAQKMVKE